MIQKILKIKDTGILENLTFGEEFKTINLIFGWNGTGKTTLSRILRNFELKKVCDKLKKHPNSTYEFLLDGGAKLTNNDLSSANNIRVFNKDFIDENIFQKNIMEDGSNISPIFYLGDKRIELTKERDEKKRKDELLVKKKQALSGLIREKENLESDKAKHIKDTLLGIKKFQNYNKNDFVSTINKMKSEIKDENDISNYIIGEDTFNKKLSFIKNSDLLDKWIEKIKLGTNEITDEFVDAIDMNILKKTVTLQKTIKKLEDDADLRSWVHNGLLIHKKLGTDACEFCSQSLTKERIEELEAYFNKEYTELNNAITKKLDILEGMKIKDVAEIKDDVMRAKAEKLNKVIKDISNKVIQKQNDMFREYSFSLEEKNEFEKEVKDVDEYCEKFEEIFASIITELENSIIVDVYKRYQSSKEKIENAEKEIEALKKEIDELSLRIRQEEKALEDFTLPVEKINEDLEGFLGHDELKFTAKKDEFNEVYYEIKRHDEIANNLSEGEKTAVSLIYFLRKLGEKDFDLSEAVVLIDDPISSLDSQFLYSAYSLIVSALEDDNLTLRVKQIIISTHHYEFFNLFKVKYGRRINNGKCGLFMLKIYLNETKKRAARFYTLDPLLKKYDSDYQYLFSKLKEFQSKEKTEQEDLEQIYPYPNIARRVLETFLSFRYPTKGSNFRDKIDATKAEKRIKESIYRFTNIKSHGTVSSMQSFDSVTFEPEAISKINEVLEMIRLEDPVHYGEMEKIIDE